MTPASVENSTNWTAPIDYYERAVNNFGAFN